MSNGNNQAFMRDPVAFLRVHSISDPSDVAVGKPRVSDFDLKINQGYCLLGEPKKRGDEALIRAHYLPGIFNSTMIMELGAMQAKYMFTSILSGCLFAAYGQNAQNLRVEHVNERNADAAGLIKKRIELIQQVSYPYCKILARGAYLEAAGLPVAIDGYGNNHAYEEVACVVGVADAAGNWSFHYKINHDEHTFRL